MGTHPIFESDFDCLTEYIQKRVMKIICAGFPKTATKSCSKCLEHYGIKVADAMENGQMSEIWNDFIHGRGTINSVLAEYERNGYEATQDLPANLYWEDLYNNVKDAKVILTVRDSDEQWYNSWMNFNRAYIEDGLTAFLDYRWMVWLMANGWMGSAQKFHLQNAVDWSTGMFGTKSDWPYSDVNMYLDEWTKKKELMKQRYRAHILYVKSVVPAEKLLIWNLKDGWRPLAEFLDKPIPDIPIPRENRTGDTQWVNKNFGEHAFFAEGMKTLRNNLIKCCAGTTLSAAIVLGIAFCWKNQRRLQ